MNAPCIFPTYQTGRGWFAPWPGRGRPAGGWRRKGRRALGARWGGSLSDIVIVKSWVDLADLASDWLHNIKKPIRSRLCRLTRLLTKTTTQKFPSLNVLKEKPSSIQIKVVTIWQLIGVSVRVLFGRQNSGCDFGERRCR